ncbi:MAG TPA: hypothetical protein VKS01_03925, partial [Bryobacteraceae bacterium]|nr:hypothetical protein [Bryobacteraceae bacterium]
MKKPVWIGILLFAALMALIVYSMKNTAAHRVQVCMQYNGRTSCSTASGETQDLTLHTAISN